MTPERWNQLIHSLLMVRLGQELGCDSPLTRAIHDLIDALIKTVR